MIGIGLSLLWLVSVATRPAMPVLGRDPEYAGVPGAGRAIPGTSSFPASWSSGWTADCSSPRRTRSRTGFGRSRCRRPDVREIVLDCVAIDFIDSQGSAKMREILELTEQAGVTLRLARVKPAVRDLLERDGFVERIGDDRIHDGIAQALGADNDPAGR